MTLSAPSFLAAATSASIPPRAAADVAVAALAAVAAGCRRCRRRSWLGGEQAAMPTSGEAVASAAAPARR